MINIEALFRITYGLYIVSSGDRKKGNGFISNTVFQVTAEPARFAVCCNKKNYTAEFIREYGVFSVSVLETNTPPQIFGTYGYKTGRNINKLEGALVKYGETGVPIVLNSSIAYLEFRLTDTFDAGSHLIFIGDLVSADILDEKGEPLTYRYYREVKKGMAPENAPTFIDKSKLKPKAVPFKKYKCPACGYIYDDAVEPVKFSELPADWVCPVCGTEKSDFYEINN